MQNKKIFLISFFVFVFLLFILPKWFIGNWVSGSIITVSTFLFGIVTGFYILVSNSDYNDMKNCLIEETGILISLYNNMLAYDKELSKKLVDMIDAYIIANFNVELVDYNKWTYDQFIKISNFLEIIPIKNEKLPIYEKLNWLLDEITKIRQRIIVFSAKTINTFQWFIIFILAIMFLICLYWIRDWSIIVDLFVLSISMATVLLILLIWNLDLYRWNEEAFGYYIFENVLKNIDRLPYYPYESIESWRIKPLESRYRVWKPLGSLFERSVEIIDLEVWNRDV